MGFSSENNSRKELFKNVSVDDAKGILMKALQLISDETLAGFTEEQLENICEDYIEKLIGTSEDIKIYHGRVR